ncbi:MAG TPA: hypothetical protein VG476_02675 [Acidimicrobiales bacterium]|nr:hypothetical protein [Acidimicrobiales bacterium]
MIDRLGDPIIGDVIGIGYSVALIIRLSLFGWDDVTAFCLLVAMLLAVKTAARRDDGYWT